MGPSSTSVIVCTIGRDSVYRTIESLKKQTHQVEIILVNDGSEKLIELSDAHVVYLKNDKPQGLSICRNKGIKQSLGEIVVFIDDDAYADPTWIEELLDTFEQGADIVGGLLLPAWEGKRPWWLKESLYHLIGINTPSHMIFGCNFAVRKKMFEELNFTFEEKLGRKINNLVAGDETALIMQAKKKGYVIKFNGDAIVNHIVPQSRLSFVYFVRRHFWEGRTEVRLRLALKQLKRKTEMIVRQVLSIPFRKDKRKRLTDIVINGILFLPYFAGMMYEFFIGANDYRTS